MSLVGTWSACCEPIATAPPVTNVAVVATARTTRRASMSLGSTPGRGFLALVSAELRQDFLGQESDPAGLVGAHLRDVDLVEAGIDVLLDGLNRTLRVGPAWHGLGDLLGRVDLGE